MNYIPIIIINWNGIQDTRECIHSVLKQSYKAHEIHIIDNCSDNEEGAQLKKEFKNESRITIHLYNENYGFTGAHNKIWAERFEHDDQVDYIALLNNDTVIDPHWLAELHNSALETEADIISSKMIDYYHRERMDNAGHKMLNTGEIIPIGHQLDINDYVSQFQNIGACAGACLYSAALIRKIGFFDPYFSTGYEDAEFGLRAIVSGHQSIFEPKAIVYHKMGRSVNKIFNEDYSIMIQTSIYYSYFKLLPAIDLIIHSPFFIAKNIILLILNVLFNRSRYKTIQISSLKNLVSMRKKILFKRREFYSDKSIKKVVSITQLMDFFLWLDIKRFFRIYIKKQTSSHDVYGSTNSNS